MRRIFSFFVIAITVVVIFGCSETRNVKNKPMSASTEVNKPNSQQQIKTTTLKYPSVNALGENKNFNQIKKMFATIAKDIHFRFNDYSIQPIDEYGIKENPINTLNNIAQYMLKHPSIKIRIEGNCDERGTIEYNLALGEKRALAAKQYLVSKGVSPDRITIISYGKSRPLDPAHNEYAWAKNRRDHFVIISK